MLEEIISRRSIRKYDDKKPVESEKVIELIDSARLAPSGSNTQPWHFIVAKSDLKRQELADVCHNQKWMTSAPVFIACVADIHSRISEDVELTIDENSPEHELKEIIRDTSIAIEHLVLCAEKLGLGTCWVGWFTQEEIRPVLNIPSDKYVVAVITVGYSDESPSPRPRKKFDDIVHYENW